MELSLVGSQTPGPRKSFSIFRTLVVFRVTNGIEAASCFDW